MCVDFNIHVDTTSSDSTCIKFLNFKSSCYRNLISDNAHDSKKLWQVLRSVLHFVPEKVLVSLRQVLPTDLSLRSQIK